MDRSLTVAARNRQSRAQRAPRQGAVGMRGSMSLQLAVIMVPVLFGMMGFAIDLGRAGVHPPSDLRRSHRAQDAHRSVRH